MTWVNQLGRNQSPTKTQSRKAAFIVARTINTERRDKQASSVCSYCIGQYIYTAGLELNIIIQQQDERLGAPAYDTIERSQASVSFSDKLDLRPIAAQPLGRTVAGAVVEHRDDASVLGPLRATNHRRQASFQKLPAIVIEHKYQYGRGRILCHQHRTLFELGRAAVS